MTISLENQYYKFSLDPKSGMFNLSSNTGGMNFIGCQMGVSVRKYGKKTNRRLAPLEIAQQLSQTDSSGPGGKQQQVGVNCKFADLSFELNITFALSNDEPLFLWKIQVHNDDKEPVWVNNIEFLRVGGQIDFGEIQFPNRNTPPKLSFFSNGWQSWSYTGAYLPGQSMRVSNLGFLQKPMVVNPGTPSIRLPGYYTADFFGAVTDLNSDAGCVVGFLSQKQQFGTVEAILYDQPSLAVWTSDSTRLDPGSNLETDWAVITPFTPSKTDPLRLYIETVARMHDLENTTFHPAVAGWCSWYQYYTQVTDKNIRENLQKLASTRRGLPLSLIQIDDGFETRVGDWFSYKSTFPDGLAPLAAIIKEEGFTPGLWLAPFILDRRSNFFNQHPEFILRNKRGNPVNAGFGWNSLTSAIDLTVPGATEEVCKSVQVAVHEWGYPYLKFDFLYAAALPGARFDPTRSRAQIMRAGMKALRDAAGSETYLLGCGLPLASGLGLVDAMRIGADVSGSWTPEFNGIKLGLRDEPSMPSARNSIQNILTRAPLHQRWWVNDPDCLLVRPGTQLSLAEVQTLATAIAFTGGSLFLSDDLTNLSPKRLDIARVLLPLLGKRADVVDLLSASTPSLLRLELDGPQGKWVVCARFNWEDKTASWQFNPSEFNLADQPYWVSSFWDNHLMSYKPGSSLTLPPVNPHGVALLAIIPDRGGPAYLGSNLHFSQGREIIRWDVQPHKLELGIDLGREANGYFRLLLPGYPMEAKTGTVALKFVDEGKGIYKFDFAASGPAEVKITF